MKTLIIALSLFCTDTLPPKATLLHTIDSFYQIQTASQLLEYQTSKKGEWLKYLPTVGLTYTLDGKPRPTISFSSSLLYRAKKDRQTIMAKRQAVIKKNQLDAQKTGAQLMAITFNYEALQREISNEREILEIDSLLFEIDRQCYERLEIPPSEYLKSKRSLLIRKQEFHLHLQELQRLKVKILAISHYLE